MKPEESIPPGGQQRKRIRFSPDRGAQNEDDWIAVEAKLGLRLNDTDFVSLSCTPFDLDALAAGFLFGEGICPDPANLNIKVEDDLIRVEGDVNAQALHDFSRDVTLTTGCGGGRSAQTEGKVTRCRRINTSLRVDSSILSALMTEMGRGARLFQTTGCTHVAALGKADGRIAVLAEDVGRHNAVDKVIGRALLDGLDLGELILLSSGRLSSEIVLKAVRAKIPVVVSRSAPTTHAVDLAERFLLTLVGFARGKRMNLYALPERVDWEAGND